MSTSPTDRPTGSGATPPPLTVAASLVGLQGLTLLLLAVAELASVDDSRRQLGVSVAVFFGLYAVVLLAAGWGLVRRSGWARGPALLTQFIGLGVAWNLRDLVLVALVLAVTSVLALVGLVHPDTVAALDRTPRDEGETE